MAAIFLFFHSELCGFLQMYAHIFVVVNSRNFTQFMKKIVTQDKFSLEDRARSLPMKYAF